MKPKTAKNPKGAGPKPISKKYSDALKRDVMGALTRKAKDTGLTFGDVLANVVYDTDKSTIALRAGAFKIVQEILLIRETQSTSDINVAKSEGPVIMLPPVDEKLMKIPEKKETKEGAPLHCHGYSLATSLWTTAGILPTA